MKLYMEKMIPNFRLMIFIGFVNVLGELPFINWYLWGINYEYLEKRVSE